MRNRIVVLLLLTLFIAQCNKEPEMLTTQFTASVSVADSLDSSGDYSGFEFLIFKKDNPSAMADTVMFAVSDTSGIVKQTIHIEKAGAYPMQISRNGRNLASMSLLIADDDTISFKAEFPGVGQNMELDSREIRALKVYDRVDKGYRNTLRYVLSGRIADSLLPAELQKWADLYWEVYERQAGTFASKFALESSIDVLNTFDRPQMFSKLNTAFNEDMAFGLAITLGKQYVADTKGFEAAVAYLDSLSEITKNDEIMQAIEQSVIKLHYDSARVELGRKLLAEYDEEYNDDSEPTFWFKNMRFDLTNLAPGMEFPEFEFASTEGDTVSNAALKGSPFVLEFTKVSNSLYQDQYSEATVIYQLYADDGLKYYTIPFDESANTIIGFFEERERFWSIAEPPSLNKKELVEDFNIQYYPTRFLVDADGKIIRKYVGEEFDDIVPDIIQTLTKTN